MTNTDTATAPAKPAAEIRRDEFAAIARNIGHTVDTPSDEAEGTYVLIVRGRFDNVQVVVQQSKFPSRSSVKAQIIDMKTGKATKLAAGEIHDAIVGTAPAEQAPVDGHADLDKAVDADRIPFEKITYDERVHRATGVKIVRLGGIWHVQAPGELPRNGGNNDTEIDNIMQYAHTVVRAVLINRAAAALGVQPHELSDDDRQAAAAGNLADLSAGPVDGFALGDVVQWGGSGHAASRKWKIARLYVPTNGREPYAGLDLLDDRGPGKTSTAGRLSLLVKVTAPAELPVDVDGTPIPVDAIVECVGAETGTMTGRRGRVLASSTEADGPGRVELLIFPAKPDDSTHARSANRVRVIELPDGAEWPNPPAAEVAASLGELGLVHRTDDVYEHPLGVYVTRQTGSAGRTWWAYAMNRPGSSERKVLCSNQATLAATLPYVAEYLDDLAEQIAQALDDAQRAAGITYAIMIPGNGDAQQGAAIMIEGVRFDIPERHEGGGTMFARRLGEAIHAAGYQLDAPDFRSAGIDTDAGRAYRVRLRDFEPVLDADGNPVPLPAPMHATHLDVMRRLFAGMVPAPGCPHYMYRSERTVGMTTCEKAECIEARGRRADELAGELVVMPGDDQQVDEAAAAACAAVLAAPRTHGGKVEPYLFEQGPAGPHVEQLCEIHGAATVARPATPAEVEQHAAPALAGEVVDVREPDVEVLGANRNGFAVVLHAPRTDRELVARAFAPMVETLAVAAGGRSTEDDVHFGYADDYNTACGEVTGKVRRMTTRDGDVTCPGCKIKRAPQFKPGDDVLDPDGRRAQVAELHTIKIKGEEHRLAMIDYFDAPDDASSTSSVPILVDELVPAEPLPRVDVETLPHVVVEASVEANPRSSRFTLDRALWATWPPARRAREVESIGVEEVGAAGGWGAMLVDYDPEVDGE